MMSPHKDTDGIDTDAEMSKPAFSKRLGGLSEVSVRRGSSSWIIIGFGLVVLTTLAIGLAVSSLPKTRPTEQESLNNNIFQTDVPTVVPVSDSAGSEDCNADEKSVEFFIELDQDSNHETGWTLECGNQEIWNVPIGYLEETKAFRPSNQILLSECVDEGLKCDFTIQDKYGDGLTEGPGSFYLKYGATTVATYDRLEKFTEKSYCFGPGCDQLPLEIAEVCAMLFLSMRLDANPDDIQYEVECDGEVVLKGPWGIIPYQEIEEETCMPISSCCRFAVTDSSGDGLTQAADGDKGWIFLEYGLDPILDYNGNQDGTFSEKVVQFGYGC
jgi:hypothetical protein